MSWALTIIGTPDTIESRIETAQLPDYAENTPMHRAQLSLAKTTAAHLVREAGIGAKSISIGISGYNYSKEDDDLFNVVVNATFTDEREHD